MPITLFTSEDVGRFFARSGRAMDELDAISETLRRQRRDLEEMMDSTLSRSGETAELVDQVEDLQRRCEETRRRFDAARARAASRRTT